MWTEFSNGTPKAWCICNLSVVSSSSSSCIMPKLTNIAEQNLVQILMKTTCQNSLELLSKNVTSDGLQTFQYTLYSFVTCILWSLKRQPNCSISSSSFALITIHLIVDISSVLIVPPQLLDSSDYRPQTCMDRSAWNIPVFVKNASK